jgi:hypothetical protein
VCCVVCVACARRLESLKAEGHYCRPDRLAYTMDRNDSEEWKNCGNGGSVDPSSHQDETASMNHSLLSKPMNTDATVNKRGCHRSLPAHVTRNVTRNCYPAFNSHGPLQRQHLLHEKNELDCSMNRNERFFLRLQCNSSLVAWKGGFPTVARPAVQIVP